MFRSEMRSRIVQKLIQAKNPILTDCWSWLKIPRKRGKLVGFCVRAGV